ncbi:MAG: hypothetical protein KatS3mg042_1417 [Rhodothermaceae bacterium]|nr:MAG: hypothetical protein KatS3mg042_1417 [Rhodothermaceae bacterium]
MDFETIFWLLMLGLYLLLQFAGRTKKPPQPQPETGSVDETDTTLEEALREIREALATEPPPPTLPPVPEPPPPRPRLEPRATLPAATLPPETLPSETVPSTAPPPRRPGGSPLARRLRSTATLREAFILKTILDPPRHLRR